MDNSTEEGRGFRQRKNKSDPLCCPICGVTIRSAEMDQHYAMEVERLVKLTSNTKIRSRTGSNIGDPNTSSCSSSSANLDNGHGSTSESIETSVNPDECWGTYQKIKTNRQSRLKIKSRKRKAEDNICPVCNKRTAEDITMHVEACLRKSENDTNGVQHSESDDDDESIDVEGESIEVYEWAGQTRSRASSLLPGGYAAAGIGTNISSNNNVDTDDELNVDEDDTKIYGPPQYSERDVVVPLIKIEKNSTYLRDLVIGNEPLNIKRNENAGEGCSNGVHIEPTTMTNMESKHFDSKLELPHNGENSDQIIESLKSKIREYECYRPKCLICMDDFKNPVVSICCWHVYCEECWLHTLGAKKLCPQCSMITSATDLRRIYL